LERLFSYLWIAILFSPCFFVIHSIIYILSAPFAPIIGFIVDRVGYNVYWMIMAVLATLGSHVLLAFTFIDPWVPMVSVISVLQPQCCFALS